MGNVFILKAIGSLLLFVLSILVSLFYNRGDNVTTIFIAILAFGHLFDSFNVIDYWFRAKVEAKYPALSRIFAVSIYSMFKIVLILLKGPLVGFIWATTLNLILQAFFYILFYEKQNASIFDWEINLQHTKDLLLSAWPLIISGIAITIYMQIDQIIIRSILGDTELGFYSSAVKISQAGYFIPTIVANTVFPAIINAKRKSQKMYDKRLLMLYGSFLWMSIAIALIISLLSKPLISFLYGAEFLPAAKVLSIHIWAFVFVSLGVASGKQLIAEDKTRYSLYRTVIGAIVSIGSNLLLGPAFGIIGASVSSILSYGFSALFSNLLFKKTRNIFIKIVKSFNIIKITKLIFINL
jgi:PST family polysaccharide transporter